MGGDGVASRGGHRGGEAHHGACPGMLAAGVRLGVLAAPAAARQQLGRSPNEEGGPPPRGRPMSPAHAQREEGERKACSPHRHARRRGVKRRAERRLKLFRFAIVAGFANFEIVCREKMGV